MKCHHKTAFIKINTIYLHFTLIMIEKLRTKQNLLRQGSNLYGGETKAILGGFK